MRPGISSRTGPRRSDRRCATTCRGWASRRRSSDRYLFEIAKKCLLLAHGGLRRRGKLDAHGRDESHHLEALDRILDSGETRPSRCSTGSMAPGVARWRPPIRNTASRSAAAKLKVRSSAVQVTGVQRPACDTPFAKPLKVIRHAEEACSGRVRRPSPCCWSPATPAQAQTNFDRPGGDYLAFGLTVRRSGRMRADLRARQEDAVPELQLSERQFENAVCWLKDKVPPRVESCCCVSGVRGAGVIEPRTGPVETSTDRFGGDYRSFEIKNDDKAGTRRCLPRGLPGRQ